MTYVVLDFETTGLDYRTEQVIEIGRLYTKVRYLNKDRQTKSVSNSFSNIGKKFEHVVIDILKEAGYAIQKNPSIYVNHSKKLQPNASMNGQIIDVKLTYNSNVYATVAKYAPYSRGVPIIIYLFGAKDYKYAGKGHRHVKTHIDYLIEKLPQERQWYYIQMIEELVREYNSLKNKDGR